MYSIIVYSIIVYSIVPIFLLPQLINTCFLFYTNRCMTTIRRPRPLFYALFIPLLIRILTLGAWPLMDPSEARYGEISRRMLATGEVITPMLDSALPFLGKPPLAFWVNAIMMDLIGVNEWGARVGSLFFTLGGILVLCSAIQRIFSYSDAIRVAIVCFSSGLIFITAGLCLTDAALLFSIMLTLSSALVLLSERGTQSRTCQFLFFLGVGLGILAKGLLMPVMVGGVIGSYCLCFAEARRRLYGIFWLRGLALVVVIALPWHIVCELKNPGFLRYYVVGEHFLRFVQPGWESRYGESHSEPRGMVWGYFLIGFVPWFFPLLHLWWKVGLGRIGETVRSWDRDEIFFLFWLIIPLLFFTPSRNVMFTYALPSIPAAAVLLVRTVFSPYYRMSVQNQIVEGDTRQILLCSFVVPVVFLVVAFTILPNKANYRSQAAMISDYRKSNHSNHDLLSYFGQTPRSAEFYMGMEVQEYRDNFVEVLAEKLLDDRDDFFVIPTNMVSNLSEPLKNMEKLRSTKKFVMYREIEGPDHRNE